MKKSLLVFLISTLCTITFVQAQTSFAKDSLSVSSFLKFNQKVSFENYQVKFKKVVSDSRCPKNVMCIRAGEARVLLSIYKEGKFIEDQEITIDASGFVMDENNLAFNGKDFKIYGMTLRPYPKGTNSNKSENYELEIVFQPKRP